MKLYHKIFAVIFILSLLSFSVCNVIFNFDTLKEEILNLEEPKELKDVQTYTSQVDTTLTANLLFGHTWNEIYAQVYNALGKNEENGFKYVRDKNGMMYMGNFWNTSQVSPKEYAMRIVRLKQAIAEKDTRVVVMLYPSLYNEVWTDEYYGIPYTNYTEMIEELVAYFRYYGIDYIDYNEIYANQGKSAEDLFYKTDHHWRVETAFDGFAILTEHLNEKYGENLDLYYTDLDNYKVETYENYFIGSQGRDAGVSYVGADDFTYIVPCFDTDYIYEYLSTSGDNIVFEGDFEDTLMNLRIIEEEDYYERDLYGVYMGSVRRYDNVTNCSVENGLKVLFLRDSFASPLASFFSAYCSNMELYWNVNTDAEVLEQAVETGDYDYIFIGLVMDSYIDDGLEFYLEEEEIDE